MDCMVEGGQVIPLKHRIACKIREAEKAMPDGLPWASDDAAIWAFSDTERDEIAHALDIAHIMYSITAEDQPDAGLLAGLHGRVVTRRAALAALQTGRVPAILEDITEIDERLKEVEAKTIVRPSES